jgi:hypothetical protein
LSRKAGGKKVEVAQKKDREYNMGVCVKGSDEVRRAGELGLYLYLRNSLCAFACSASVHVRRNPLCAFTCFASVHIGRIRVEQRISECWRIIEPS